MVESNGDCTSKAIVVALIVSGNDHFMLRERVTCSADQNSRVQQITLDKELTD